MKTLTTLSFCFFFSSAILASDNFYTPSISVKVLSADSMPIEDVSFGYNLSIESLSLIDHTSIIPLPTLPHWKREALILDFLGKTNEQGELYYQAQYFELSSIGKRNPQFKIFSNGYIDFCKNSFIDIKFKRPCSYTVTNSDSTSKVNFICLSSLSKDEIDELASYAIKKCH